MALWMTYAMKKTERRVPDGHFLVFFGMFSTTQSEDGTGTMSLFSSPVCVRKCRSAASGTDSSISQSIDPRGGAHVPFVGRDRRVTMSTSTSTLTGALTRGAGITSSQAPSSRSTDEWDADAACVSRARPSDTNAAANFE